MSMLGFVGGLGKVRGRGVDRRRGVCGLRASFTATYPVDPTFVLADEVKETIDKHLNDEKFVNEVAIATRSVKPVFTGMLFQPQWYSVSTPRGVPKEFEPYLDDPNHVVVHVMQTTLLMAGCFKPSKLCAIYRVESKEMKPTEDKSTSTAVGKPFMAPIQDDDSDDDDDFDLDTMVI